MSSFTDVATMNKVFGNPEGTFGDFDMQKVKMYLGLIKEEVAELEEALDSGDWVNAVKENMDVLVVAYGLAHVMGIDADARMKQVSDSNMSKTCANTVEAEETRDFYMAEYGLNTVSEMVALADKSLRIIVKVDGDQVVSGKFYPHGKFLKGVGYDTPDFSDLEELLKNDAI
jgi:NTP pyrophosphatase (non-canonical NTP hydrolase)